VLGIDRFKDNDNELFSTSDHLMIECDLVVETITADLVMIRDCYNKADYDKSKEKMLATPQLYGHLECVENWLKGRKQELLVSTPTISGCGRGRRRSSAPAINFVVCQIA